MKVLKLLLTVLSLGQITALYALINGKKQPYKTKHLSRARARENNQTPIKCRNQSSREVEESAEIKPRENLKEKFITKA